MSLLQFLASQSSSISSLARLIAIALFVIALTSCSTLPAPTPYVTPTLAPEPRPDFVTGSLEDVAPAMIAAERYASISGDVSLLGALWAADARIIDGRATQDPTDDYIWEGRDAILDRYAIAVFPAPPPALDPAQLDALVIDSIGPDLIQAEIGVDRWTLVQKDGCWWLAELRYN